MLSYVNLFENSDGSFKLRLEFETLGFDFEQNTRRAILRLMAENSSSESVIGASSGALGSLSAFGMTFTLPDSFNVSANTETAIFDSNEITTDNNQYYIESNFTLDSKFVCGSVGLLPMTLSGVINFCACPRYPSITLSCGSSVVLGENIVISSSQLDDGMRLKVTVIDGEDVICTKYMTSESSMLYADPSWAERHTETTSFSLKIKAVPIMDGTLLPVEAQKTVFCSLPSESSGPAGAVTLNILYEDGLDVDFGVPIVNRSRLNIAVSNVTCYQGATLRSSEVRFDGFYIPNSTSVTFPISTRGFKTWSVTLTDSRGYSKVYSGELTVFDYGPPDFSASVERVFDEQSSAEDIRFNIYDVSEYSFEGANSYSYAYRYRNCAEGDFSGWIATEKRADITVDANMEINEVYELQIRSTDSAGLSTEKSYTITCERTDLHIGRNRLGIGKKATSQNKVECAWDIACDGDISFTSGEGTPVSLRSLISGASTVDASGMIPLVGAVRIVSTDEGISDILGDIFSVTEGHTFCTLALCVTENGLSLSKGVHFYIIYNDGVNSEYTKI